MVSVTKCSTAHNFWMAGLVVALLIECQILFSFCNLLSSDLLTAGTLCLQFSHSHLVMTLTTADSEDYVGPILNECIQRVKKKSEES